MSHPQKFHFIAIGGSVMHNLAIALSQQGHQISGSDDDIQDPSKSKLSKHNLLPSALGWFPDKIDNTINAVILGMHAKKDNPELLKAESLGLPILSFPEFIYNQSINKQRIVICGSHGKTTITALLIHVLSFFNRKFDYVIGAQQEGMENTVKLTDAPIILIEGDEYLSSPLDPTAKFLKYHHHMAIISGIAWDHANVFPTSAAYEQQFELLADASPKCGTIIYNSDDKVVEKIAKKERADVQTIGYTTHDHVIENGVVYLIGSGKERTPIQLFGKHNLQNISAAKELLKKIGISNDQFYEALPSFKGADGRLQKIYANDSSTVYKDFAHAPSKVKASTEAIKSIFPKRHLIGCLELHTYSSMNKTFLPEYNGSMKACDTALVFFNPEKVKQKGLEELDESQIKRAFDHKNLVVFTDVHAMTDHLKSLPTKDTNLAMMSSGNFNGLNLNQLAETLFN
ncbi:MAG: Mur ligase family protein [Cyclobacteriaceae bacterium]